MGPANVCPSCGGRVTPFAAGCSWCGFDLDRFRRSASAPAAQPGSARRLPRARLRRPDISTETSQTLFLTVVIVLMAVYTPLYGLLFSGLVLWDARRRGSVLRMRLALAGLGLTVLGLFVVLPRL